MHSLPAALAPLDAYRQFIVCQFVPDTTKPGKTHKYPLDYRTGKRHDAHDPAIWTDATTAYAVAAQWGNTPDANGVYYGVGFVFTVQDPFFFIDVDACAVIDTNGQVTGEWTPIVSELCGQLNGAAVEVSQSGRGLHIIGTGTAPTDRKCKDHTNKLFDLYTEGRFVALGPYGANGNAATVHTLALHNIVDKHLKRDGARNDGIGWTDGPCEGWNGPTDDDDLIARMMRSQSSRAAFGAAASFADLWQCNVDALAKSYPPDPNGTLPYDGNRVDAALAQHLAFWTGKDCERIYRLMYKSGLVRGKWDREDYLRERTIPNAVSMQRDYLTDKQPEPRDGAPVPETLAPQGKMVEGKTFLNIAEQIDLFNGCSYVCDAHKVLVPGGVMLKPDQFRVMFGGYSMPMDSANERTSRDSWETFTQSQAYRSPRADSSCFRPDCTPGAILNYNGHKLANVYWPVETPRKAGDVTPFLRHLAKLLPNERDQTILLSYMAAVVQYKGRKFQWMPILQGVEGNGKTLFTRCVAFAVGDRYSYFPGASQITDKFNDWMYCRIFVGIEDIYVPEGRDDVIEALKPMVTGDKLEIQGKGEKKETRGVCFNMIANSNHKDMIRKTRNDRRFCIMYCLQQAAGDIIRDGMGGNYFPELYEWLRGDGYAIVSELLHTYPIPPEFNPAIGCQIAPVTSSTEEAITVGLGGIEQEVQEAVAQGLPGFVFPWISSIALDRLLDRLNATRRIPQNKRRDMLFLLGYDLHPGLKDGRVNNIVLPDAGKPRLFIHNAHTSRKLTMPSEIAQAYATAQQPTPGISIN